MTLTTDTDNSALGILNQFAISLLQQKSLDDLLWSMAANLGEVLGFEDCVIYLKQDDDLVQKAAYGVKNPDTREIKNEIVIKSGEGIVGSAAQYARTEYVADLSRDARYIPDEFSGLSELAVPLISEGKVIGVLDSESSKINGFDQHDIEMLESLANIASPRIATALAHLETEMAEQAMREARQEAERANQAKSEFLSRMNHELKTPLNAILGFAKLMKLDPAKDFGSRIDLILLSGEHLLQLINESLDVLRAEQDAISLDLQPVEIGEVISNCVDLLQVDAAKYQVTLNATCETLLVNSDNLRLRQVMLNLISNAIKYNRTHGKATITARATSDSHAEIVVEDTGIGMTPEELENLYTPFMRFGERKSSVEGHGIGMMICRQIVRAMGGELTVTSTPGDGTRCVVLLPKQIQQSVA